REERDRRRELTERQKALVEAEADAVAASAIGTTDAVAGARRQADERRKQVDETRKQIAELATRVPTVNQPRTNQPMQPRALDRVDPMIKPGQDPREPLAAWMTGPANESFSGAMVNRLWRHFMGVGLVEPVDDLRSSHPPSNPELSTALSG